MSQTDILARFAAGNDDIRKYLRAPFRQGDYIYATDGKVAVRFQKSEGLDAPESDKPHKVGDLFDKFRTDNFLAKFPQLPPPDKCPACNGTGIGYECPECDGTGEFKHGSHTYECKECDGSGDVDDGDEGYDRPCWHCGGSGHAVQPVRVSDIQHFDRRLLVKLKDLPGIRFAPAPTHAEDAAYFTFEGGEGLLMPIRA